MISSYQVLTIGGCGVGISIGVESLPLPGETIRGNKLQYVNGGKASNHAIGLTRLGIRAGILTIRGKDAMGSRVSATLNAAGVPEQLVLVTEQPTMIGALTVERSGENTIVVASGALEYLSPEVIREHAEAISSADAVLVSLEIPTESAVEALRIARKSGVKTYLNLSPNPAPKYVAALLDLSDVVVANRMEAIVATDSEAEGLSPEGLALRLRDLGGGVSIVTLGSQGCVVADDNGVSYFAAHPVDNILDSSGAGDAFMSGFVAGSIQGWLMADAVALGSLLASFVLQGPGFVEALQLWPPIDVGQLTSINQRTS